MQNLTLQILFERYKNATTLDKLAEYACTHSRSIAPLPDLQCTEFPIKHSVGLQIFVATAFTLLIICALIGNSLVMWVILYSKAMRSSFNFFLFNMAIADFLMALLNAGSTWSFNFYYQWYFGNHFCPVNHFFGVAPTCVSIFTMMVVSWDRSRAIVDPLKKRQLSAKRTTIIIAGIWFLATIISLPAAIPARIDKQYFFSIPKKQLNERTICHNDFKYKFLYDNFLFAIQYVSPLFVLTLMYGRIIYTFRSNNFFEDSNVTKASNHYKAKKKVIKMLGIVVAIFMVCWAPYQMYHLFIERLLNDFIIASYTYMVFYWLAMSACVYNPIIYCYFNVRFRIGFRYAFRWLPFFNFQINEREYSQLFPDAARMITSSTALKSDISKNRLYSQRNTLVGSKSSTSILLSDFTQQRDSTTLHKP